MAIALMLIAGEALPGALRRLAAGRAGRVMLTTITLLVLAGMSAAGVRVARATSTLAADGSNLAASWERVTGAPPALDLTDQRGQPFSLTRLTGRPALVTFAFGHCTTACPLLVHEVMRAQALVLEIPVWLVIVTLDPWRDTPQRLGAIADRWRMGEGGYFLGGTVAQVEGVLEAWNVPRSRDPLTGEVTHGTPVYVIGRDGRLAYRAGAVADTLALLLRSL
jgi:protein SCO1/2